MQCANWEDATTCSSIDTMYTFTLTPQAADQVRDSAHHSNCEGMFLRVTGRPGDAGSVIYGMGFDEHRNDDLVLESEGISIVIAPDQAPYLNGAVLDFARLNTGHSRFVFVNPNDLGCSTALGGCGHCEVPCRPAAMAA